MPVRRTVASVALAANPILPPLPTISNLSLWAYFGGSLAQCENAGSLGALTLGAGSGQVFQPNYVGLHGLNGSLATPVFAASTTQTWMAVMRCTLGGVGAIAQVFVPSSLGVQFQLLPASLAAVAGGLTSPQSLVIANNGGNNWKFYAFTASLGGAHMFYNLTDNTNQLIVANGTMVITATNTYGIGGVPTVTGGNTQGSDFAWIGWSQSLLTKATIDVTYAHVKAMLKLRGITDPI